MLRMYVGSVSEPVPPFPEPVPPFPEPVEGRHGSRTAWDLMVMPRSRSMSIRSRYCARAERASTTPVSCSIRSASVDLPWSMCAMMQKFRMRCGEVAPGWLPGSGVGGTVVRSWWRGCDRVVGPTRAAGTAGTRGPRPWSHAAERDQRRNRWGAQLEQAAVVMNPVDEARGHRRRTVDELHEQRVMRSGSQRHLHLGVDRQLSAVGGVADVRLAEPAGVVPLVDHPVRAVGPVRRDGGVRPYPDHEDLVKIGRAHV